MARLNESQINSIKGLLHYLNDDFDKDGELLVVVEVRTVDTPRTGPPAAVIDFSDDFYGVEF